MQQALQIIEVIISILLIVVILIQSKSVSLNLSSMSGGMDSVKKRGSDKVLQNMTIVLGIAFVTIAIILYLIN